MKIIETKPGDQNFHLFEKLPELIYSAKVLQKNGQENINPTYFKKAFVLVDQGSPKARIVLYENPYLKHKDMSTACLGNYECVDDIQAGKQLLLHAINEAKAIGADYIIGPMNGSTWDNYRFNSGLRRKSFFMEKQHPSYYNEDFKMVGFKKMANYFSSIDKQMNYNHLKILNKASEFAEKGLIIRSIDLNNFEAELKKLYPFITEAFKNNFLYTPISWEYFKEKYHQAKTIINTQFVTIAEDKEGEVVGFYFCVQDLFNQKEKSLIIKTIVRKAGEEWRGLGHVMGNEIYKRACENGFQSMIHAFIKNEGFSTKISKNFSGELYKNYALYGKAI